MRATTVWCLLPVSPAPFPGCEQEEWAGVAVHRHADISPPPVLPSMARGERAGRRVPHGVISYRPVSAVAGDVGWTPHQRSPASSSPPAPPRAWVARSNSSTGAGARWSAPSPSRRWRRSSTGCSRSSAARRVRWWRRWRGCRCASSPTRPTPKARAARCGLASPRSAPRSPRPSSCLATSRSSPRRSSTGSSPSGARPAHRSSPRSTRGSAATRCCSHAPSSLSCWR